ncbi:unnamed protein product [Boreogadus saida]
MDGLIREDRRGVQGGQGGQGLGVQMYASPACISRLQRTDRDTVGGTGVERRMDCAQFIAQWHPSYTRNVTGVRRHTRVKERGEGARGVVSHLLELSRYRLPPGCPSSFVISEVTDLRCPEVL